MIRKQILKKKKQTLTQDLKKKQKTI